MRVIAFLLGVVLALPSLNCGVTLGEDSLGDNHISMTGDTINSKGTGAGKADGTDCRCDGWIASDEELKNLYDNMLILVDREYALPQNFSNYAKKSLVDVAPYNGVSRLRPEVADALSRMAAASNGLVALSADGFTSFRSFYNQCEDIYHFYKLPQRAAMAGHSEHETGLAADLDTRAFAWLLVHAFEFGFVQSYPGGYEYCTGYMQENWHWRYIGTLAALEMKNAGITAHEYLSGVRCDGSPIEDLTVDTLGDDGQTIQQSLFEARRKANELLYRKDVKTLCQKNQGYETIDTCDSQYPGWLRGCDSNTGEQFNWRYCAQGACQAAALGVNDSCAQGEYSFLGAQLDQTCGNTQWISTCSGKYLGWLLDCSPDQNRWNYCPRGCHSAAFGQNDSCN